MPGQRCWIGTELANALCARGTQRLFECRAKNKNGKRVCGEQMPRPQLLNTPHAFNRITCCHIVLGPCTQLHPIPRQFQIGAYWRSAVPWHRCQCVAKSITKRLLGGSDTTSPATPDAGLCKPDAIQAQPARRQANSRGWVLGGDFTDNIDLNVCLSGNIVLKQSTCVR